MVLLNKEDTLFDRDEKGEIIPQRIILKTIKKEEIVVTPLLRGEIKRIFNNDNLETTKDNDEEIILNHCIEPKYSVEDLKITKPYMVSAIVNGILEISGIREEVANKSDSIKN